MAFEKYKKARRESKAFKEIVAKDTLAIRRKAYYEEAKQKAVEEGKALARKIPTSKKLAIGLTNLAKQGAKKIIAPPKTKKGRPIDPYTSNKKQIPFEKPVGFEFM